jgi:hypothetical protein
MNDLLTQLQGGVLQGCQNGDCEKPDEDVRELTLSEIDAITGAGGSFGHGATLRA